MATSSEDILLLVNHVRYQKKDGTLFVMAERIGWMIEGKEVFSVSHKYVDIKTQKISPDGKPKVQLQVVLHEGGPSTFQFTNPEGQEAQLKDRNDVKEILQQQLPRFKRKINNELAEKNRMLAENPDLLQLYYDLVTSQVITPEEFWSEHAVQRQTSNKVTAVQDIGVSGAFLADIKPQMDGCNGLKYNLSTDLIYSIFKTYPAVKKKHIEYVPHKMSENEFWTRFFQSHYFHRDRISSGNKDVFADCAKTDEQDVKQELSKAAGDPLLDITSFVDSSLDEGYGLGVKDGPSSSNLANRNLIRRFNYHSMMVLKTSGASQNQSAGAVTSFLSGQQQHQRVNGGLTNGIGSGGAHPSKAFNHVSAAVAGPSTSVADSCEPSASKRAKIVEKTRLEDLESCESRIGTQLRLQKKERYLHGPTPVFNTEYISGEELQQSIEKMQYEVASWNQELTQVLPSNIAVSVLKELSPGGLLMKSSTSDTMDQLAPDVIQELRNLYNALCELLRHFWACFPITSDANREKAIRMNATLERFQYAKLKPFQDRLHRDHFNTNLIDHMTVMLESSYAKLHNWQAKQVNMRL